MNVFLDHPIVSPVLQIADLVSLTEEALLCTSHTHSLSLFLPLTLSIIPNFILN